MTDEMRSVDTPHYHVWTDALHARQLAREANDKWNRGTYVRWATLSACSALESACAAYLGRPVGWNFKDDVNAACDALGVPRPDWGQGTWQRVLAVRVRRNGYVHLAVPQQQLFSPVTEAEEAIDVMRAAVLDLAAKTGHAAPAWVLDDEDIGSALGSRVVFRSMGYCTAVHAGAEDGTPDVIRLCYVHEGREHENERLAPDPDFDPEPALQALAKRVRVPVSAVRAYRGDELILEIALNMRGT